MKDNRNNNYKKSSKTNTVRIILVVCMVSLIVPLVFMIVNRTIEIKRNKSLPIERGDTNIQIKNNQSVKSTSTTHIEYVDVKNFFYENSKIVSIDAVKDSNTNLMEKDAIQLLKSRGFGDYPITTNYSINGIFEDTKKLSTSSTEYHPIYETYFYTTDGYLWVITVTDGTITAYPSTYNYEHLESVPIMVSESEVIVSYDSCTGSFYRTIPKETIMKVRIVDRVDVNALELLDLEG